MRGSTAEKLPAASTVRSPQWDREGAWHRASPAGDLGVYCFRKHSFEHAVALRNPAGSKQSLDRTGPGGSALLPPVVEPTFARVRPGNADFGKSLVRQHPLKDRYRARELVRRRHQHRQAFGCAGTHVGIRMLDEADQLCNEDASAEASLVGCLSRAQQPDNLLSRRAFALEAVLRPLAWDKQGLADVAARGTPLSARMIIEQPGCHNIGGCKRHLRRGSQRHEPLGGADRRRAVATRVYSLNGGANRALGLAAKGVGQPPITVARRQHAVFPAGGGEFHQQLGEAPLRGVGEAIALLPQEAGRRDAGVVECNVFLLAVRVAARRTIDAGQRLLPLGGWQVVSEGSQKPRGMPGHSNISLSRLGTASPQPRDWCPSNARINSATAPGSTWRTNSPRCDKTSAAADRMRL